MAFKLGWDDKNTKVAIGEISLSCRIQGKTDAPWVIFSNSLATNQSLWRHQVEMASDNFQVLTYDQRGHGQSDAPQGPYSIDLLAEDLLNLMNALKIEKAALVGISMGGMTAITVAKKSPERVTKLVACDCGPAASQASAEQWQERISIVEQKGIEAIVDETVGRWFAPKSLANNHPAVVEVAEMVRSTSPAGYIGSAQALSNFDLRPGLSDLAMPTLFISGKEDAIVGGVEKLHQSVQGSQFVTISDAGHLCNIENPDEFNTSLRAFLLQD